ncbi:MAG TPA: helix-turn-helix transcriptional regulator [Planctomycetota bacterium]|nr:helix-turn-helix transcriptional regulator [Planctomycetota bacterium]
MTSAQRSEYRRFLVRLRAARSESGLTQGEVAARLSVDQSWISKVERGVRRLDVIELCRFAKLYKKSARYFVPEFPAESG